MSLLKSIADLFVNKMAIDLGTANTLIYLSGKGIVLSEPSVVAVHVSTGRVIAVGMEAKKMLDRTPGDIVAIRPMKEGVIADFEAVNKMIKYFINKVSDKRKLVKPTVVIAVPAGITEVEKRAVREAAETAGAAQIILIEQALAAAIGANLPIHEPTGHMVVDIGGGTTEIAVVSLGGIVVSKSIKVGGDKFDEAIMQYLKKHHNLIIGEPTAENIKKQIGSAFPLAEELTMEVKGRDAVTGLPRTLVMDSTEIREAIQPVLMEILEAVKHTLDQTPPELAADLVDRGIVLTGGGALLKGLPQFLSYHTKVPVILAENPIACVALGAGKYLEEMDKKTVRPLM